MLALGGRGISEFEASQVCTEFQDYQWYAETPSYHHSHLKNFWEEGTLLILQGPKACDEEESAF